MARRHRDAEGGRRPRDETLEGVRVLRRGLEEIFPTAFVAALAQREKQVQQSYRPLIGIHKWFARRPGTVFRNLLLSEFNGKEPLEESYWHSHELRGVIADPFMGGGTTIYEANRLGFNVVGTDINPMAFWIVRQSLARLDLDLFVDEAASVISDVEKEIGKYYVTKCEECGEQAPVKYFLWVKMQRCSACDTDNDLFPGYLLAEAVRHPRHVVVCRTCGQLNEFDDPPTSDSPAPCRECGESVSIQGTAIRNKVICGECGITIAFPSREPAVTPRHRMWAIEYQCSRCKPGRQGRFFKRPDKDDLRKYRSAAKRFEKIGADLPIPDDEIPAGDESGRLHRWGYARYREMFGERQLLGLGFLLRRIRKTENIEVRHALLTVFSDFLRYQNMLCRYDTYALKCQDIFSVHGFPVGLVQCENSMLGIPRVGSGAFRHFVEKYIRAKSYCHAPFETRVTDGKKETVRISGEKIEAVLVDELRAGAARQACIHAIPATEMPLSPSSLDGVFTDPPYFDNVQYAELMDFCFVWLRQALEDEFPVFRSKSTRAQGELTGNETMGRGLDHFTEGLSNVFRHYAAALKPGAPFVFTYHHNDPEAYVPLVVAILDAGLDCTATLPAPGEMGASLHIARSKSSVLDSVFVCRVGSAAGGVPTIREQLQKDTVDLKSAGLKISEGDLRCLLAGHIARTAVNILRSSWDNNLRMRQKMAQVQTLLVRIRQDYPAPWIFEGSDGEAHAKAV